ncbi:hypothetical protein ACFWVT_01965 [Streptomyces cyaneofuscatus]|uniref:hypothetical protein n=1 Tax=Streptomyces griseus group TaxID=629295 RepID=UPI00365A7C79
MEQIDNEPGKAETQARDEVLAAIARQARSVGERIDPEASRALEHLARALAALAVCSSPQTGAHTSGGLQIVSPGQERAGGHKVGLALELEQ